MESIIGCSESCRDVRNPIKLSSGCCNERYLMRQRYLRSYPLMMIAKKNEKAAAGNVVAMRATKWLKEKRRKYCGIDQWNNKQTVGSEGDHLKKTKPRFPSSSCFKACLNMLLVCVAKVDRVAMKNQEKPTGFESKKL